LCLEPWNEWQLLVLLVPTVGSRFTAKSTLTYPEREYTNEGEEQELEGKRRRRSRGINERMRRE
jgi:hypothetical protein